MEQQTILCSCCGDRITILESVGSIYYPGRLVCSRCADEEVKAKLQEEYENQYENGYFSE